MVMNEDTEYELVALESIYPPEELSLLSRSPVVLEAKIRGATPDLPEDGSKPSDPVSFSLTISLPSEYPNALPALRIHETRGMSNQAIDGMKAALSAVCADNIGTAMVYAVVEAGKERVNQGAATIEMVYERDFDKKAALDDDLVFEGDPVTLGTF